MPCRSLPARCAGAVLALVLGSAAPALAGSPVDDYIAARDKVITRLASEEFSNPDKWEQASAIDQKSRVQLGAMVRAIVGPVSIQGFDKKGDYSVESLVQEVGFGRVDGMSFNAVNGNAIATVTTVPLIEAWAKGEMKLYPDIEPALPLKAAEIVASTDALNMALITDAAIISPLKLPVTAPAGASVATAFLGVIGQDTAPVAPDTLFVSVIRGDRVTMFTETLEPAPQASATCTEPWEKALKDSERISRSGKDEDYIKAGEIETKAFDAFTACIAQTLPKQPEYAAAVKRAQTLADLAP